MADRYSVIVIPQGCAKIKRWEVSRQKIYSGISGVLSFFLVFVLSVTGFLYYHHGYTATQDLRTENLRFKAERSMFLTKLDTLERTMTRAKLFATRLAAVVGLDEEGIKVGLGPITDTEDFLGAKGGDLAESIEVASNMTEFASNKTFLDNLNTRLSDISEGAVEVSENLADAVQIHEKHLFFWSSVPSIWPTRGWITSGFGVRSSPLTGKRRLHAGLDIACPTGTRVISPGDGIVTFVGRKGGYGQTIIVDHGYGIATMFGHNSKNLVTPGQKIKRGEVIAYAGNTGISTGPHLHYEVQVDGVPVDPMRYILEDF